MIKSQGFNAVSHREMMQTLNEFFAQKNVAIISIETRKSGDYNSVLVWYRENS